MRLLHCLVLDYHGWLNTRAMRTFPKRVLPILPLLLIVPTIARGAVNDAPRAAVNLKPVADLAQRVVPWLAKDLVLEPLPKVDGKDVFELSTRKGKLIIRASDVPSAAAGLSYYLKYFCHRSLSHVGNNLAPVRSLPMLRLPVRKVSPFQYRYLLNYCTLNYTLAFADWNRWQRELDWMALNGVNLALATTGTEGGWQNTQPDGYAGLLCL